MGSCWAGAFTDLQQAINAAANDGPGPHTIYIAQGTYLPSSAADRDDSFLIDFNLTGDLTILGGYRGNNPGGDPDDRDIAAFPTILSGDLACDDDQGFIGDNSRHVFVIFFPSGNITIDGLSITAGRADGGSDGSGSPAYPAEGAGLNALLDFSNLTLREVTFSDHVAGAEDFANGPALAVRNAERVTVDRCVFNDNTAGSLGGAALILCESAVFTDCSWSGNQTTDSDAIGGALYVQASESTQLINNDFELNTSGGRSGATHVADSLTVSITDGTWTGNAALGGPVFEQHGGGALTIESPGSPGMPGSAEVTVTGATFVNNSTNGYGGAIRVGQNQGISGDATITGCTFSGNSAGDPVGGGGAIALANYFCQISDSTFTANSCGGAGGAVEMITKVDSAVAGCLFESNESRADDASAQGGGLRVVSRNIELADCRFVGNAASSGGGVQAEPFGSIGLVINRCLFHENLARRDGGGGLKSISAAVSMFNTVFSSNHSDSSIGTGDGGGAHLEGVAPAAPASIVNCTFAVNTAQDEAGGLWTDAANGNAALEIVNSIFWENERDVPLGGEGVSDESGQIHVNESSPAIPGITVAYCDIQNLITLNTVPGTNINISPNFAGGQPLGTRRVQRLSEVLDAGDGPTADLFFNPAQTSGLSFFDVAGYERYVDDPTKSATGIPRTQDDPTVVIDMGAHERFQICPGDLNDDCAVDSLDLGLVLGNFQTTGGTEWGPGDANGDGDVNGMDLNLVVGNFGEVCECDGQFAPEQGESAGGGSQQAAGMGVPLGAPNEGSVPEGESAAEPIEPDVPNYLLYLGWTSEADYALWLNGLSEQDRLIHMIELVQAYEAVGE